MQETCGCFCHAAYAIQRKGCALEHFSNACGAQREHLLDGIINHGEPEISIELFNEARALSQNYHGGPVPDFDLADMAFEKRRQLRTV